MVNNAGISSSSDSDVEEDEAAQRAATAAATTILTNNPLSAAPAPIPPKQVTIEEFLDSPKLAFCLELIVAILAKKERVVVFSSYVACTLKFIGACLTKLGITFGCIYGDMNAQERQSSIEAFTNEVDGTMMVMLCSTKAGGVGLNLVSANHCIIFDHSWNPTDDTQATYRVYRYGQKRNVTIYRLVCDGTIEHLVYHHALSKEWMHKKLGDGKDPQRVLKTELLKLNYHSYPCQLPNGDSRFPALKSSADAVEACRKYFPVFGPVLSSGSSANVSLLKKVLGTVKCIVEHAFILRDDILDRKEFEAFEDERKRGRQEQQNEIPLDVVEFGDDEDNGHVSHRGRRLENKQEAHSHNELLGGAGGGSVATFEEIFRGAEASGGIRGVLQLASCVGKVVEQASLDFRLHVVERHNDNRRDDHSEGPPVESLERVFCQAMAASWPLWQLPRNPWSVRDVLIECFTTGVETFVGTLQAQFQDLASMMSSRAASVWKSQFSTLASSSSSYSWISQRSFSGAQQLMMILSRSGSSFLNHDDLVRLAVNCNHARPLDIELMIIGIRETGRRMADTDVPRLLAVLHALGVNPQRQGHQGNDATTSALSLADYFYDGMLSASLLSDNGQQGWGMFVHLPRRRLTKAFYQEMIDLESRLPVPSSLNGWLAPLDAALECVSGDRAAKVTLCAGACPRCGQGRLGQRDRLPETEWDDQSIAASTPRCTSCFMSLDTVLMATPHCQTHCTRYRWGVVFARHLQFDHVISHILTLPDHAALSSFVKQNEPRLRRQLFETCSLPPSSRHAAVLEGGLCVFDDLHLLGIKLFLRQQQQQEKAHEVGGTRFEAELFAAAYGDRNAAELEVDLCMNSSEVWFSALGGTTTPNTHLRTAVIKALNCHGAVLAVQTSATSSAGSRAVLSTAMGPRKDPAASLPVVISNAWKTDIPPDIFCAHALQHIIVALCSDSPKPRALFDVSIALLSSSLPIWCHKRSENLRRSSSTTTLSDPEVMRAFELLQICADCVVVDLYLDLLTKSDVELWKRLLRQHRTRSIIKKEKDVVRSSASSSASSLSRSSWSTMPSIHDERRPRPKNSRNNDTDEENRGYASSSVSSCDSSSISFPSIIAQQENRAAPALTTRSFPSVQEIMAGRPAPATQTVPRGSPFPIPTREDVRHSTASVAATARRCSATETRARLVMFASAYRRVYGPHCHFAEHDAINFLRQGVSMVGADLAESFTLVAAGASGAMGLVAAHAGDRHAVPATQLYYSLGDVVAHCGKLLTYWSRYVPLCTPPPALQR